IASEDGATTSISFRPRSEIDTTPRRRSAFAVLRSISRRASRSRNIRDRLGPSRNATRASSVTSIVSTAASARRMRHCCSVRPCWRSEGRNCRITASRARSSDIGSEREKSRIGTRRAAVERESAAFDEVLDAEIFEELLDEDILDEEVPDDDVLDDDVLDNVLRAIRLQSC